MKRLLCITGSLGCGGAEAFLMKIYRHIDREQYQFDFCINTDAENFYENEVVSLGGKIFRIEAKTKNPVKFKTELSKLVHLGNYEYVLRISSNAIGFWDLKIAKKAGAKVCCVRSSNSSDGSGIVIKLLHAFGRFLFSKYIDVAIAPSDLAAKYTFGDKAYMQGKVKILHNAIDLNVYSYSEDNRKNTRDLFGIADDEIVIGHIGRFTEQKNHEFLIDVFYEIQKNNPNSRLILVGNGPLEERIRYKIQKLNLDEKVIMTGIRTDIPQLLAAMDVLLLPSLFEGMPNVVIEAQAIGIPCVIADTITKTANITGLVEYVSISASPEYWARISLDKIRPNRVDTKKTFLEKKYDIGASAKEFVNIVFGDNTDYNKVV